MYYCTALLFYTILPPVGELSSLLHPCNPPLQAEAAWRAELEAARDGAKADGAAAAAERAEREATANWLRAAEGERDAALAKVDALGKALEA